MATDHLPARRNIKMVERDLRTRYLAKIDRRSVTCSMNIFMLTPAPASAHRIKLAGPRLSPNSFSSKASSARLVELTFRAARVPLVAGPAHFDRSSAGARFAPMAFVPIESFARAAIVAHKN